MGALTVTSAHSRLSTKKGTGSRLVYNISMSVHKPRFGHDEEAERGRGCTYRHGGDRSHANVNQSLPGVINPDHAIACCCRKRQVMVTDTQHTDWYATSLQCEVEACYCYERMEPSR